MALLFYTIRSNSNVSVLNGNIHLFMRSIEAMYVVIVVYLGYVMYDPREAAKQVYNSNVSGCSSVINIQIVLTYKYSSDESIVQINSVGEHSTMSCANNQS